MKKLILYGNGKIADVLADYFARDSAYEIVAYTCEASHVTAKEHRGRPLVPFHEVQRDYPPDSHDMHVAVGYHQLNRLRERLFHEAKAKGYRLASFVSSRSWPGPSPGKPVACGENCFIADGVSLEPETRIGDDVALWSNVVVGHHSKVGDHCWVAAGTVIGGTSTIGERSFLALNSTVGHEVTVGADCLIGARALVTKSLPDGAVVIDRDSEMIRLNSEQFLRISKLR